MANTLYPVFLRLDQLHVLIVGGGEVAREKLHFILKSSPDARITLVAPWISPEILDLFREEKYHINLIKQEFSESLISNFDIVIAATNIRELNQQVWQAAKKNKILVNVADTPALCDFYMGSIVTKGDLKIGISTNGTSPTFAKRFRQLLEDILPEKIEELLPNLKSLRDSLKINFEEKVTYLNEVTKNLLDKEKSEKS